MILSDNLQLWLVKDDPDSMRMLRPLDMLAVRLTRTTLELLTIRDEGKQTVFIVDGWNLFLLWTDLVCGKCTRIQAGYDGVSRIREVRDFSLSTMAMFPDPNPVRPDCYLFETGTSRVLWHRRSLEVFALRKERAFLFQFKGNNAYLLAPNEGAYGSIRNLLLDSNLNAGTENGFSVHPPGRPSCVAPYRFQRVEHKRRDVAAEGNWEIILDERRLSARPSMEI